MNKLELLVAMHRRTNRTGTVSFSSLHAETNVDERNTENGHLVVHHGMAIGNGDSLPTTTEGRMGNNQQQQQQQQQRRRRRKRRQVLQLNPFSSLYQNMEEERELVMLVKITGVVLVCTALAFAFLIYFKYTQRPNTSWWAYSHFFFYQISQVMPHFLHLPMLCEQLFGGPPNRTPSKIYTIPNSLPHIGDKSDEYAILRKEYDERFPLDNAERSLEAVRQAQWNPERAALPYHDTSEPTSVSSPTYDIYNCPDEPVPGYPKDWYTLEILRVWPPDFTQPPPSRSNSGADSFKLDDYQGICVFDYFNDYTKILSYRKAEVPYVVRGDPQVAQAVERWNAPGYLSRLLTDRIQHRTEYSESKHFLYWLPPRRKTEPREDRDSNGNLRPSVGTEIPPGWKEPTKHIRMTFDDWISHANVSRAASASDRNGDVAQKDGYYYFRLIGCGDTGPSGQCDPDAESSEWLFDELEFFQPRSDSLYLVNATEQRGIHCRFGMAGVTAENHFDGSRNSIVMLSGARRYILSHPDQCERLALFPREHPSARHSSIKWDAETYYEHQKLHEEDGTSYFPEFKHARSNQVVLQAGDVL